MFSPDPVRIAGVGNLAAGGGRRRSRNRRLREGTRRESGGHKQTVRELVLAISNGSPIFLLPIPIFASCTLKWVLMEERRLPTVHSPRRCRSPSTMAWRVCSLSPIHEHASPSPLASPPSFTRRGGRPPSPTLRAHRRLRRGGGGAKATRSEGAGTPRRRRGTCAESRGRRGGRRA
jgi:hypothetical protein